MRRISRLLMSAGVFIALIRAAGWNAPAMSSAAGPAPKALVDLLEVDVSLRDRSLVVSGLVRNSGPIAVSQLVIDATGYGVDRDLTAFSSDGIPWVILPGRDETFQIFLPLGQRLTRTLVVQVSKSRPALAREATTSRILRSRFYRALALREVRVEVDFQHSSAVLRASAGSFPVESVTVEITLLVQESRGFVLHSQFVEVPIGGSVRVAAVAPIVKIHRVRVIDVTFSPPW